jgi:hypothetical protein
MGPSSSDKFPRDRPDGSRTGCGNRESLINARIQVKAERPDGDSVPRGAGRG